MIDTSSNNEKEKQVLKVIKFLKVILIYAANVTYFNSIEVITISELYSAENRNAIYAIQGLA